MKTEKKIPYLDYECIVGEKVQWNNIKGERFVGTLLSIDTDSVATVQLENGKTITYQC